MLIKPETHKQWEDALSHFNNVDKLIKSGELQKAVEEATLAFVFGQQAINKLSSELNLPDLSVSSLNALSGWFERISPSEGGKHYTPKEHIEWARKILRRLSEELPPDTLPPFRG